MADFNYTVDTRPMASSIDSMENHVKGTISAVAAMEAAVIAAELQSSKNISSNIDRGFYMLIRSQISQKLVAAYTEMSSKLLIMQQFAKTLDNIKKQMMSDYQMISRRYYKLFQSLNKSAESNVRELDGFVMDVAAYRGKAVERQRDDGASALTAQSDTYTTTQAALSAKLKLKAKGAINSLNSYIGEMKAYNDKVHNVLNDGQDVSRMNEQFLPVIISYVDSFIGDTSLTHIHISNADASGTESGIVNEVTKIADGLGWCTKSSKDKEEVKKEFFALCGEQTLNERTAECMKKLFDGFDWMTLCGSDSQVDSGITPDNDEVQNGI